jgi:hypothetical protein
MASGPRAPRLLNGLDIVTYVSHLMTRGGECGRPDGHTGQHRSVASLDRRAERCSDRYYALTGFQYNLMLLQSRRRKALGRKAARAARS